MILMKSTEILGELSILRGAAIIQTKNTVLRFIFILRGRICIRDFSMSAIG